MNTCLNHKHKYISKIHCKTGTYDKAFQTAVPEVG